MRKTLKPSDTIPENAVFCSANLRDGMIVTDITVEVPDPTPPAPKMIVFVADGEPRKYSGDATHYLNIMGDFLYCGAGDTDDRDRQHYRQLPAEQTLTLEDLKWLLLNMLGSDKQPSYDVGDKLSSIIAAMEARNA